MQAPWPTELKLNPQAFAATKFLWHMPTAIQLLEDSFILKPKSFTYSPFSSPGSISANLQLELLVALTTKSLKTLTSGCLLVGENLKPDYFQRVALLLKELRALRQALVLLEISSSWPCMPFLSYSVAKLSEASISAWVNGFYPFLTSIIPAMRLTEQMYSFWSAALAWMLCSALSTSTFGSRFLSLTCSTKKEQQLITEFYIDYSPPRIVFLNLFKL